MSQEVNIMNYKQNKQMLVERAKKHRAADNIIQGDYWEGGKGCCVGCLAETSEEPHEKLSVLTGAPVWLFKLADKIHEGLTEEASKDWPAQFAEALSVTPDKHHFWKNTKNHWRIVVVDECLRNKDVWFEQDKEDNYASDVVTALELVKELAQQELLGEVVDWSAARTDAYSAAESARSARSARSAAYAARYTTYSAAESARSAAESAGSAGSAWSARSAWSAAYQRLSEELVKILQRNEVKD